ncbi:MAG: tetratricopeptide repeat protein [Tannerella sp.]|jgi:tetratricopeptide (TPR) repeat protein|nr:tetratricopeptide repeat protein [Tannerella sp.]
MALMFVFSAVQATAQKAERSDIRKGNGYYKKEKFTEAEIEYRKSIEVNPRSMEGIYNLGNTLYRQEKYPEAAEQYNLLAGQAQRILQENPKNVEKLSQVFHNLGNIGMRTKEYQKSVDAYKQALRFNPKDDETRYNLALAQKLLSDQQQQDQNQDQNKDEQNKDEQQQQDQKDQEQEQNQDQQQQPKEDQQQKTQEQQQPNEQMSRDNAQQMLDAFLQDEKDTQEKVKKIQMQQQQSRKREKQW